MDSIFTKIINREISAYIIAENDEFIAFLDVFPYSVCVHPVAAPGSSGRVEIHPALLERPGWAHR